MKTEESGGQGFEVACTICAAHCDPAGGTAQSIGTSSVNASILVNVTRTNDVAMSSQQ